MDSPTPTCGACCGHHLTYVGDLALYLPDGQAPCKLSRCEDCGTYARSVDFDDREIRRHFDVTSYTVPEVESGARSTRAGFFRYIIDLASHYEPIRPAQTRVLDVGAAFGHLLDMYHERGAECAGIEIVDWLRERLRARGYGAFKSPSEIPAGRSFDVIAAIDSLYYIQQPGEFLRALRSHLKPEGILIVRVANRTPVFRLLRAIGRPITNDVFGDVKYNFSYRGIRSLLEDSGFRIERVVLREKGKTIATRTRWLYYKLSLAASHLTGVKLTPGLILVCRRGEIAEQT